MVQNVRGSEVRRRKEAKRLLKCGKKYKKGDLNSIQSG
jgi:hypothetical protein